MLKTGRAHVVPESVATRCLSAQCGMIKTPASSSGRPYIIGNAPIASFQPCSKI